MPSQIPRRLADHPTVRKVMTGRRDRAPRPDVLDADWLLEDLPERRRRRRKRLDAAEPGFRPSYKAAYCLAVCPAGKDVIEPYLDDRKAFMDRVLKPLQDKRETLYVLPNSAAKAYAEKRFPHKPLRIVNSG